MKSSRRYTSGVLMFFFVLFLLVIGYLGMKVQYSPENLTRDPVWQSIIAPPNDAQVRCFVSVRLSFARTLCTRNWSESNTQAPIEVDWVPMEPPTGVIGECVGFHEYIRHGIKSVPVSGVWCN